MKPTLLILVNITDLTLKEAQKKYNIIYAPDPTQKNQAIQTYKDDVQVVLTNGIVGLTAQDMQCLSKLQLVCTTGAGYEKLDVAYAHAHGIATSSGAGTNANCVADHAMALLLAVVRHVVKLDRCCRHGIWRTQVAYPANVSEKKMGILGLGTIGQKIAQRALGFDMQIAYHNRHKKNDVDYQYFDNILGLATWADFLIICAPGGMQTQHIVNAGVLEALGENGFLINVGRGAIVDTQALAFALKNQVIAGAGLDVYESEPHPPQELIGFEDSLVITPHIAAWSPESIRLSENRFLENVERYFSGLPLICSII